MLIWWRGGKESQGEGERGKLRQWKQQIAPEPQRGKMERGMTLDHAPLGILVIFG